MLTALSKLEFPDESSEKMTMEDADILVSDRTKVSVIYAKTDRAKQFLLRFTDKTESFKITSFTNRTFEPTDNKSLHKSRYPLEYLTKYLKFMEAMDDNVIFEMSSDYPIKIENDDFIVYIAPRVD